MDAHQFMHDFFGLEKDEYTKGPSEPLVQQKFSQRIQDNVSAPRSKSQQYKGSRLLTY